MKVTLNKEREKNINNELIQKIKKSEIFTLQVVILLYTESRLRIELVSKNQHKSKQYYSQFLDTSTP